MLPTFGGMLSFALALLMTKGLGLPEWLLVFGVLGFAVAWISIFYAHYGALRCPSCRSNLAGLVLRRPGLRIDPRLRVCPYCELQLDGPASHADSTEH
jgi:hypothetical protein